MRMNIASPRPSCRAFFCWAAGSLPARIEMKIDVVDAQDDLEERQGEKRDPRFR